jgi:hypothetical protein
MFSRNVSKTTRRENKLCKQERQQSSALAANAPRIIWNLQSCKECGPTQTYDPWSDFPYHMTTLIEKISPIRHLGMCCAALWVAVQLCGLLCSSVGCCAALWVAMQDTMTANTTSILWINKNVLSFYIIRSRLVLEYIIPINYIFFYRKFEFFNLHMTETDNSQRRLY